MKKIQLFGITLLMVLCGAAFVGCGSKAPEGFPEVHPFTVKVVDGSKPIEGVIVRFNVAQGSSQGSIRISGKTDSSGVAVLSTGLKTYSKPGVPVGEYRVRCEKEPLAEHWKTPEERSQMSKPEKDAYLDEWLAKCAELPREVPKIWNDYDKTPLTASVAVGGGQVTFDVEGKAND